jgi:hypothetical protein
MIIDPVTQRKFVNQRIEIKDDRSLIYYMVQPNQSLFFVFKETKSETSELFAPPVANEVNIGPENW